MRPAKVELFLPYVRVHRLGGLAMEPVEAAAVPKTPGGG